MNLNQETRSYWESVDSIVNDIVEAVRVGEVEYDEYHEMLHEAVDGNHWVIYTYQAKLVVCFISDNDNAAYDQGLELDHSSGIDWSGLAYYAMEADVNDRMPDLEDMIAERDAIAESKETTP